MDNKLMIDLHILVHIDVIRDDYFNNMITEFCGKVTTHIDKCSSKAIIYLCGNIELFNFNKFPNKVIIIGNYSYNNSTDCKIISCDQLPRNYYNIGILINNFFDFTTSLSDIEQSKVDDYVNSYYTNPSLVKCYDTENCKDIDENALIAFCTFCNDRDLYPKQVQLKLKTKSYPLIPEYVVTLYESSLFIISSEKFKLYNYEIIR